MKPRTTFFLLCGAIALYNSADCEDALTFEMAVERHYKKGTVELGNAAFPSDATEIKAHHKWRVPAKPTHKITFIHSKSARMSMDRDYRSWATRVTFHDDGENGFRWIPPRICRRKGLACIYGVLYQRSLSELKPLAKQFKKHIREQGLNAYEATILLMTFVQNIHYQLPTRHPFGVLPPALVASYRWGDCDSKSLLLHMLLEEIGVHSIILSSNAHAHAVLAVAIPSRGSFFRWRGKKYAIVETTSKTAPLGFLHPKLLKPNDWVVVPIIVPPT